MAARLGEVIYWIFCIAAMAPIVFFIFSQMSGPQCFQGVCSDYSPWLPGIFFGAIALAIWLVGRGTKYILAGR